MSALWIERLALEVPGLSETDGRRLALQVAEGLSSMGMAGGGGEISALRVDLTAPANLGVNQLARQIVAEVLRQVEQSL